MNATTTLTPALRAELTDALTDAIADNVHGDHVGYLEILNATPDGFEIADDHDLADVINYFGIETD